jgi:hypothetical protein
LEKSSQINNKPTHKINKTKPNKKVQPKKKKRKTLNTQIGKKNSQINNKPTHKKKKKKKTQPK